MEYTKLAFTLLLLLGVGYIYDKLKMREENDKNMIDYNLVRNYLLNDYSLAENKKPIIWIHISYDVNSREWCSFGSRNTRNLNQPYLYLTIKSIINKCGEDFYICLIDDDSFKKLLPSWGVDLMKVSNPIREHLRKLALAKVLYNYGGVLVPNSFVCFKNIYPLYEQSISDGKIFVGEFLNRTYSSSSSICIPNMRLMGAAQFCPDIAKLINYLEISNSKNFTAEASFSGNESNWLKEEVSKQNINMINADELGVVDKKHKEISIEQLISNTFLELNPNAYGLYIPSDELLRRTNFNWFVRLSPEEVLMSNTQIGKYILVSAEDDDYDNNDNYDDYEENNQ